MQRSRFYLALALVAAAFLTGNTAQAQPVSTASFVHYASVGSAFETTAAKIALTHYDGNTLIRQNVAVKLFAKQMLVDHAQIAAQLDGALARSTIGLTADHMLRGKARQNIAVLQAIHDHEAFDEQYANIEKQTHQEAIALYRDYAMYGDDPELRAFAAATLPMLEGHLETINSDLYPTQ